MQKNILKFTDLKAWQEAHSLTMMIYLITKSFPKDETFGIISQMRRASVSIGSNIAEGFGRAHPKDKLRFYFQAHGSLIELKSQTILSRDLDYLKIENFDSIFSQSDLTEKILYGLMRSTRNKISHTS